MSVARWRPLKGAGRALFRVVLPAVLAAGSVAFGVADAQVGTYVPPKTIDGIPDLQGVWQAMGAAHVNILAHSASSDGPGGPSVVVGGVLPYQDWAVKRQQENYANRLTRDGERQCHLSGVPRATYLPHPFRIVQTPAVTVMMYEYAHQTRRIYTNKTQHQPQVQFYLGDSRGRYEGNTLVVDVKSFNGATWFDRAGNFHSDALEVEERYTRTGRDHMRYEATITDPKVFTRPWKLQLTLYRNIDPNAEIVDYQCYAFEDRTPGQTVPLSRQSPLP